MKLNSKSGATLAAAAATLFLAGAVGRRVSSPRTPLRASAWRQCLQGPERLQGLANSCKGQNACKTRLHDDLREGSAPPRAASSSKVDRRINA